MASRRSYISRNVLSDVKGDAVMKAVILAGGLGTRLSEETGPHSQADDQHRWAADTLAHHENV